MSTGFAGRRHSTEWTESREKMYLKKGYFTRKYQTQGQVLRNSRHKNKYILENSRHKNKYSEIAGTRTLNEEQYTEIADTGTHKRILFGNSSLRDTEQPGNSRKQWQATAFLPQHTYDGLRQRGRDRQAGSCVHP